MRETLLAEYPLLLDCTIRDARDLSLALQPYLIAQKAGFTCLLTDECGVVLDQAGHSLWPESALLGRHISCISTQEPWLGRGLRPGQVREGRF